MLAWVVGVVAIWSAAAAGATWRTERLSDAVKAGVILGVATTLAFHVAAIVRVNLFLDVIRYRTDWQNLVARYQQSGFESLRTYATYEYVKGTPAIIALGAIAGAISGAIGGLVNTAKRAVRLGS